MLTGQKNNVEVITALVFILVMIVRWQKKKPICALIVLLARIKELYIKDKRKSFLKCLLKKIPP